MLCTLLMYWPHDRWVGWVFSGNPRTACRSRWVPTFRPLFLYPFGSTLLELWARAQLFADFPQLWPLEKGWPRLCRTYHISKIVNLKQRLTVKVISSSCFLKKYLHRVKHEETMHENNCCINGELRNVEFFAAILNFIIKIRFHS